MDSDTHLPFISDTEKCAFPCRGFPLRLGISLIHEKHVHPAVVGEFLHWQSVRIMTARELKRGTQNTGIDKTVQKLLSQNFVRIAENGVGRYP